jgi:hypothetical protein
MPVVIAAKAKIIATGELTRLYRRNRASANIGGDGYALRAVARITALLAHPKFTAGLAIFVAAWMTPASIIHNRNVSRPSVIP